MTDHFSHGPVNLRIRHEDGVVLRLEAVDTIPENAGASAAAQEATKQLAEYFQGRRRSFELAFRLSGTAFQRKVYEAVAAIPYGETRSYRDIAALIGNPAAARAVGGALNKNPLLLIVPCHRVVGSKGELKGFRGGPDLKKRLLELEREAGA
jgi:O-6-methylguanine DNA methyltransferase